MALTLSIPPSIPVIVPDDYVPSMSVSALDTVPGVGFGSQVTVTVTTILGDTATLNEGTDYFYNPVSDEVFFYHPVTNSDTIQFSVTPDYSITDLSTQFSDLGAAPAEGSNLRDKQLLQMARDLDARILALGGQGSGGGTSAGVSSLVVGDSSYDGVIQIFAGDGLSFLEGTSAFQIDVDSDIRDAVDNVTALGTALDAAEEGLETLTTTVGNIRQVPDSSVATIGQVLTVNNSNEAEWQTPSGGGGGGGGATRLNELDDVTLNSLTNGQVLVSSGGTFVNMDIQPYLLAGDVAAVALSGEYSDLLNPPTLPTTEGGWGLITDRATSVVFNAPNNEPLASGYVWRWNGSQFKPAQLDIQDVNTAGNQPLADLMAGTTEAAPSYGAGDASKVLTVSGGGSSLEWATAAASSGPRIWSCYFDSTTSATAFNASTLWQFDNEYANDDDDEIVDRFGSGELTVGSSIGSYSSGEFSITETGTYKVSWGINVASFSSSGARPRSSDLSLLRNTGGSPSATDEVLRRSMIQILQEDFVAATEADHAVLQYHHSSLVSLNAGDSIFLWLTNALGKLVVLSGSWMIEKVG